MSAQLEEERKQYEEQLEIVSGSLKDDPNNVELVALRDELEQMIKLIDDSLADLKPKKEAPKPPVKAASPPAPAPQPEKWSRENHPAFKKPAVPATEEKEPEPAAVVSYQVNDNVMAKWISGDKGWYPARITSVTGSSTKPIYTVKFKSYDTVETLGAKDIRPIAQKRKADGSVISNNVTNSNTNTSTAPVPVASVFVGPTTTTGSAPSPVVSSAASNGVVLTASPSLYPQAQLTKDANGDEKAPKKFKKIKANKELEAGKNKWQEFNNKSKFSKSHKKDSMFRTPDGVNARVGFTGSGQAMRKDPTRSRHVYQPNEDLD